MLPCRSWSSSLSWWRLPLVLLSRSHFWRSSNPTDRPWQPLPPNVEKAWRNNERFTRRVVNADKFVPPQFAVYDEQFQKVVDFDQQMRSLESRGFLRTYKAYSPPSDLEERFSSACLKSGLTSLEQDMRRIHLDNDIKFKLLNILAEDLKHRVPNSLLHTMTTLANVFAFYSAKVDTSTPYERLQQQMKRGELPPNLHVLEQSIQFDGSGNHPLNKTTAYPRMSEFPRSPEEAKHGSFYQSEHGPWFMGPEDVDKHNEFFEEK